jgi:hypothetical protein
MMRLFSLLFLFSFSNIAWAEESVFQGRIDLGRDLASFESSPPVKGTLYLITGAASSIRIVSTDPFLAEVVFVQGEWQDDANLVAHQTTLRFEGAKWAHTVVVKKPRQGGDALVYPYRKFQVAALASGSGFQVLSIPYFF